jgi:glycosyltransferase involved in cell wall biosynthesis
LVINPENLGAARSRNEGIFASKGAYITFLDDDDIYLPTKIRTQMSQMQSANADYSLMDLTLPS